MRWLGFLALQSMIVLVVAIVIYKHQDHVIILKQPPASLAQWYKPQNKRQVWLHTMFKLRREMLAVELYANAQDQQYLQKWSAKLIADYSRIGEMVPEWSGRIDNDAIKQLTTALHEQSYPKVLKSLSQLEQSCNNCHVDFRAVTAMLYRAPDFSGLKLKDDTELALHMRLMSEQVNRIKIGIVDHKLTDSIEALAGLEKEVSRLGSLCSNCHKTDKKTYPDQSTTILLAQLRHSLEAGTSVEQGRALGTLAVEACANCHATHRLAYDVSQLLGTEKSWRELLRHSF